VPVLRVYVQSGCPACLRARRLADEARAAFPALRVDVVNLSDPVSVLPAEVFATPTFVLDGEVLSLGNPRPAMLLRRLAAAVAWTERLADR